MAFHPNTAKAHTSVGAVKPKNKYYDKEASKWTSREGSDGKGRNTPANGGKSSDKGAGDKSQGNRFSLPYGLCAGLGINTDGMTPREAWDAYMNATGKSKTQAENEHWGEREQTEPKDTKQSEKDFPKSIDNSQKSGKIEYREAKTQTEAKRVARETFGIYAEYEKMSIEIANAINKNLATIYDEFGNLHNLKVLEGIRSYPKKASWYACYSPSYGSVYLRKVRYKNSFDNMRQDAIQQKNVGFWSTDSAEHAIRHELGHAIENAFVRNNSAKNEQIENLRKQCLRDLGISVVSLNDSLEHKQKAGEVLSYYALWNTKEFVAEAIAEYLNGNPRPLSKKIIEIIKEK